MEDDDRDVSAILVDVIVQRCVDRSPTVRAKALELLAQVLREASAPLPAACPALFRTLLKRCSDERPGVRKSAVQALMALCARPLDGGDADDAPRCPLDVMGREGVLALVNLAADDSTLVRRCAAECIAEVLRRHPTHDTARRLWLDAVLPLVGDKEASVEAAGVKLMREAIIAALLTWKSKNAADADGNRACALSFGVFVLAVSIAPVIPHTLHAASPCCSVCCLRRQKCESLTINDARAVVCPCSAVAAAAMHRS
jgi:HEAT repeat protein